MKFLAVLSVIVIASLWLHAIVPHYHTEDFSGSDQFSAAFHGVEKKYFLTLFLTAIVGSVLFNLIFQFRLQIKKSLPFFNLLKELFRSGTLHPKLYA